MFPNARLVNSEMVKSDHRPLIVNTDFLGGASEQLHMSPKRFEARWLKEETVEEIVQLAWTRASSLGHGPKLMEKANAVHADLHTWDHEVLKKLAQRMKKLKKSPCRVNHACTSLSFKWCVSTNDNVPISTATAGSTKTKDKKL